MAMTHFDALFRGDPRAWDSFAADHLPGIHSAVRATLRRYGRVIDDLVEDLAQDVLVKLVREDYHLLRQFDPQRAALSTWLALIARSTTIDHLRRARLPTAPLEHAETTPARQAPAPPEPVEIPAQLLSPRQRLVLQLSFDEELSVEQIATRLGIDPQTVRSTKHKALEKLRAHFGRSPGG